MLVECNRCGAPLDIKSRSLLVKCSYCGATTRLQSSRKLAAQTPEDWKPPDVWRPPARSSIAHRELQYKGPAKSIASCLSLVVTSVILLGVGGAVLAASGRPIPIFGKVARWDGKSTLTCDPNGKLLIEDRTASVNGTVIDASTTNCQVTIRRSHLSGTVVVQGGLNAEITVEDSTLDASDRAIVGDMNTTVTVRGQSVVRGTAGAIEGGTNLTLEVDGPARIVSDGDAVRGPVNLDVTLRGASIEAGGVAVAGNVNPKLHAVNAHITGGRAAFFMTQNADVELEGCTVKGERNLGANARIVER